MKKSYDGWGELPTIEEIKDIRHEDGWGEIPTIGEIKENSDNW